MESIEKVPIKAKDAKIGGTYITEMKRVVTVMDISRFGEGEDDVAGVSVKGKGATSAIMISGASLLFEHDDVEDASVGEVGDGEKTLVEGEDPQPVAKKEKAPKEPKPKKEKVEKEPKEPKLKMSHIMNEMIFAGKSPEEIADAVIAAFPEQAKDEQERKKLIGLIKGPRIYNLKKRYPERFATVVNPEPSSPLVESPEIATPDAPQPPAGNAPEEPVG